MIEIAKSSNDKNHTDTIITQENGSPDCMQPPGRKRRRRRFQYFRSVLRSKSALPKRKFNLKTFNGVSIIRREANIPLPYRILKDIHVLKSTFTFIVDIFVLRFQYFRSVPRSKSVLPKRKFNFKTLKGVSIIRREANIPLPYRI